MFGIKFIKADPHVFILHYQKGKIRRRGPGLSFFYYAPTSSIVAVPVNTVDIPFAFQLVTKDFQTVTLQGQLSYRITDPERLAGLLNFTLQPGKGYMSDDPAKLPDRLLHLTQTVAHALVLPLALAQTLVSADALATGMLSKIRASEVLAMHGVEVLTLSILGVRPTPDMAKALEAETREQLQQKSDQATYARRNAAVEQERKIKESELNTELAVEAKRREIRESQMAGEIAIEEQRTQLLEQKIANERKEADSRAYALAKSLTPLKDMDWRTLMAVNNQGVDSKMIISLAFRELAEKAQKIGTLNITPDLLQSLTQSDEAGSR
jgi:regulator of protease activity HflC (stomatin/prohibitin superfamily)